ncbi:MAG: tRNA preQ1(34) S-adenosylmethionine ribosyltransferase-isomerase QueA [Thiotrichaceae bacterium]
MKLYQNLSDFHYELPPELIAQEPLDERTASRLLQINANTDEMLDGQFRDVLSLINEDDLLVFNDTKVIPARLFGTKETGGKVEVLVERVLNDECVLAHIRASKSPKPQTTLLLEGHIKATVLGREGPNDSLFKLKFNDSATVLQLLEKFGHIPLPPYIERSDKEEDKARYQTVFADKPGAVAAPTAGLHFDDEIMQALKEKGVAMAKVTLHVGAGTFQPVKTDDLAEHIMHAEYVEVSAETCDAIEACHHRGGRVVAVGTTTVRSLESACAKTGKLEPFSGDTRLFITPGYQFKAVDVLLTNFHLPGSTLLMLVSAFAGYDAIFNGYAYAVEKEYRFFSYGDAMFLTQKSYK